MSNSMPIDCFLYFNLLLRLSSQCFVQFKLDILNLKEEPLVN